MSNSNVVVEGKLLNSGHAPYKDDAKNQQSYFIELENRNGSASKFWGMNLEQALSASQAEKGDQIGLVDLGIVEGTRQRAWDIEKYEPLKQYENSIENEPQKEKVKSEQKEQSLDEGIPAKELKKTNLKDEIELPDSIKNNYIALVKNRLFKDEKINFYDKENNSSIAFEDRKNSLNTSRHDPKTVNAMLDLAQAKNWTSINLKGTEEFKKQVWLEASLRGIETKGFSPSEQDKAELLTLQEQRTNNKIQEGEKVKEQTKQPDQPINESVKEAEKTNDTIVENPVKEQTKQPNKPINEPVKEAEKTNEPKVDKIDDLSRHVDDLAKEFKKTDDLKKYIDRIVINGINNKEITGRNDLLKTLENTGINVLRFDEKSITIQNPVGTRNIRLQGELYDKDLKENIENEKLVNLINSYRDEVPNQEAGVSKETGLDKLRVTLDSYKDQIGLKEQKAIHALHKGLEIAHKDQPDVLNHKLGMLADKVKEIAEGKHTTSVDLTVNVTPDIDVSKSKQSDQDRSK